MRRHLLILALSVAVAGVLLFVTCTFRRSGPHTRMTPSPETPGHGTTSTPPVPPDEHEAHIPHGEDAPVTPPGVTAIVEELSRSPLVGALPHSTARYRIDAHITPAGELTLTITLNAVLNHAAGLARYTQDLRDYKAEALAFIGFLGGDPSTLDIEYIPPEAASL